MENISEEIPVTSGNLSDESEASELLLFNSLSRLDKTALGVAVGTFFGTALFVATNILILRGGDVIGPNLVLLEQFFGGYEINFVGSLIGFFYGFVTGFAAGWTIAFMRNTIIAIYIAILKFKRSLSTVNDFIDNP